ncbi:hypothetical protein ABB37_05920 [Leptomonas pyrrhocoris]|uniref:Uncharacterized protein n=1 Tax=Leptomonas pyrrhocoris TaxID=157538 RepID=A0A0M9FYP2_LEPPY|nr:hypothetical protein ABB37_05919 [Leptomonas pyrrhocoris]XP_015657277.1 hypothetical protein ABB37_05919 [Leptomonas pyrrhocoris]XP_015657278.1 hypothetical protein ABB37_05919 [Leptomonas pyrrhocoris]XP_015657279.1 hypothetical protein ABB37_05920 [Leptomonas pyrrhocoris]XP_015657280.1 hypothetical protein ABB37_05920 [Leptomonas pyrrhocoris]KPA78837.1 hypothetical protein ABB37_05919 [Leptomonas pyrrhocoris]KPA78838.1 hypothetical protein ABB37_05919 [Leptomonas pyrrhocoris]KPA78839.1 h|eukprot:XP_015657276.1 hypothetical protein ABB37_05919 [Leptomonas pyrrhocoris]
MMDEDNVDKGSHSTPAKRTEGVSASSRTDGAATPQSTHTPSHSAQVDALPVPSPPPRDEDASNAPSAPPSAEGAAASPGAPRPSNLGAGGPAQRRATDARVSFRLSADAAMQKDAAAGAPRAPDEGEARVFSAPAVPPSPRCSDAGGGGQRSVVHAMSAAPCDGTEQSTTSPPATADGSDASHGASLPSLPPDEPAPEFIEFLEDPEDDGYGFRSFFDAITNPQFYTRIQYSLRTVAFVTLPLYTLSLHPNTQYRLGFPQLLVASIVSTSTHRPTVGEQIGTHSWAWRGIIYMLILGSLSDAWGSVYHKGAWYGLLAAGIFCAGLVNNGRMRRFMFLYYYLYMMELRTFNYYFDRVPVSNAAYMAAYCLLGSVMGVAANIIPFPCLISEEVDAIITKIFGGFGKLLFGMINFVWSSDVHAATFFYDNQTPFTSVEAVLSQMSSLLWFASWEPMEFPLRNPIRRVKLTLLRRIMALAYAAFSCGRTIAAFRQQQADRIAMHKIRCRLYEAAYRSSVRTIEDVRTPLALHGGDPSHSASHGDAAAEAARREAKESVAALRANSYTYVTDFAAVLMQAMALIGATESTPEQLLKKVPFDELRTKATLMRRNLRLEMLQVMKMQSEMVARQRAREQAGAHSRAEEADADAEDSEATTAFSEERSSECPSAAPRSAAERCRFGKADARLILEHRAVIDSFDVFLRINEIFFHLLMGMIAGEVVNFGDQMAEYKPAESLFRRWWRHYIVEAWDGFWSELWYRMTLARPTDYRAVKDAVRMTCAYVGAVVLNTELWNPPEGLYFFGVSPLMGLPVEEESLSMGICRIGGNTLGCALGYLIHHNTHNFAQEIAMTLCFTFVLRSCQYHPQYGQFFFYGAVITLAGLATAMVFNDVGGPLLASSYTVMAYVISCVFIFPIDCRRVCYNFRSKLTKVVSETIDDVAFTARLPMEYSDDADDADGGDNNEPVAYPAYNTEPMQMCSQLNVELTLVERLQMMCDKWAPFAARDLVIRGSAQFPAAPNSLVTLAHDRLVANLRLLVFGVQLLHRPRSAAPSPTIDRLVRGSLADFLDDFADAVRLVGADHVQALQQARAWSYPRHLRRVSQLRRLRVRLYALMHECYVLVANNTSKGTFGMTAEDFDQLRLESAARRVPAATAAAGGRGGQGGPTLPGNGGGGGGGGKYPEEPYGLQESSLVPGAGGSRVDGVAPPSLSDTVKYDRSFPAPSERIEVRAGEDAPMHNLSFADRFLMARRDEELAEEAQPPRNFPSRCASPFGAYTPAEPLFLDDAGSESRAPPQQQQQHRRGSFCQAFFSPGRSSFPSSPHPSAAEASPSAASPTAGRRRARLYVHRAHLQQSGAEPAEVGPPTTGDAVREVEQMLKGEKKRLEAAEQDDAKARVGPSDGAAGVSSPQREHPPVMPSAARRSVSRLILLPDEGPEPRAALYKGPGFTFVEDVFDVPRSTDFSAITTILLSCESIMTVLESLPGSLNSLVNYDKQLEESSIATAFLDKWSARLIEYRKAIYDRYHYPKPPPQKHRPLNTQEDPFEDWQF